MRNLNQIKRRGFTLIEMAVVVLILAIVALSAVVFIGKRTVGEKTYEEIVTETSMLAIRDAISGTATSPGAWADLGHQPDVFPTDPFWLTLEYDQLPQAYTDKGITRFDPITKIGWRGPYLKGGFRASGGSNALLDSWGNPLTIVVPNNDVTYARLVSRGENEKRDPLDKSDTDAQDPNKNYKPGGPGEDYTDEFLTKDESLDDIVLFFFVGDSRQ